MLKLLHLSDQVKSVTVKVVDKCRGCNTNDIDLSPAAFERLANESLGRIQVTWDYVWTCTTSGSKRKSLSSEVE